MKKILLTMLMIDFFGLSACANYRFGTLPYVRMNSELKEYPEERPDTLIVRTCDDPDLTDVMSNLSHREQNLIGLRDFEIYKTSYGATNCWKVRGIPIMGASR